MGDIKVQFGALEELAGSIKGQVNAIENYLSTLEQKINYIQEVWEGASGSGFQSTKDQWLVAADHLRAVLAKIETAVVSSTEGYSQTEQKNAARWEG
jgi:early secretory antigenic target protein ESAT-6